MGGMRIIAPAMLALSCSPSVFPCSDSAQCGDMGVCEPEGFCSILDATCENGRRFDDSAGNGLAGTCVERTLGCGAVEQACCATGPACGDNAFCVNGTCQACAIDVEPGRHMSCVIRYDHTLWCVGENEYGQLGFGLAGPPITEWTQVRDDTGAVISDAQSVSLGWEASCVIRGGGALWCWGVNNNGQLGNDTTNGELTAVKVLHTDGTPLTNIAEVDVGTNHTCARDTAGGVWCWGINDNGELGDGTMLERHTAEPVLVGGAPFSGAIAISVGKEHNCVRKADDTVWCWGRNLRGEIGDGTMTDRPNPVMVATGASVSAGRNYTCLVRHDNTVWCWGDAWRNRIGNGAPQYDTPMSYYVTPEQVLTTPGGPPLTGAKLVSAGGVSCVIMQDGALQCWGDGTHAQTGTGAGSLTPRPVLKADLKPLTDVDRIVAPHSRACARRADGSVWCWGNNLQGGLGDGTLVNQPFATPLRFTCQ